MKSTILGRVLATFAVAILACNKKPIQNKPIVSFNIINAVMGGNTFKVNALELDSIKVYSGRSLGMKISNGKVSIRVWSQDLHKPYYNEEFGVKEGDLYSLYLAGKPDAVEPFLVSEQVPAWYSDSIVGVRVANFALGGGAISVNIRKDPTVPIISSVNYKTVSKIVKVSLPSVIPIGGASFEIRDAVDNKLLVTYTLPVNVASQYPGISISLQRFKNITLVLKGSRDTLSGPNAFGVFPVAMSY